MCGVNPRKYSHSTDIGKCGRYLIITEVHYNHVLCKQTQGWTFKVLEMLVLFHSGHIRGCDLFVFFVGFFLPRRTMEHLFCRINP